MQPTTIRLQGIVCRCRVGVPAEERAKRQRIVLDLEIAPRALRGGRYADYQRACERARAAAEGRSFRLVEELGDAVARAVLSDQPAVRRIKVAVRKRPAVMPGVEVVVELERGR